MLGESIIIEIGVQLWTCSFCTSPSTLMFFLSTLVLPPVWKYSSTFIGLCKWVCLMEVTLTYCKLIFFIKSSGRAVRIPQWALGWVVLFSEDVNFFFQMANVFRQCLYGSNLFTSAFAFSLQRTYKHLLSHSALSKADFRLLGSFPTLLLHEQQGVFIPAQIFLRPVSYAGCCMSFQGDGEVPNLQLSYCSICSAATAQQQSRQ